MFKSRWISISLLAIAVACLGASLRGRDWLYKEWAIQVLHGATISLILAMIFSRVRGGHRWERGIVIVFLFLAVLAQFYLLFTERPGSATNTKWVPKGPHVSDLGPQIPRLGEGGLLFRKEKHEALAREKQELTEHVKELERGVAQASFDWMKGEYEKEIYTARYRIGEIDSSFLATRFQIILLWFAGFALGAINPLVELVEVVFQALGRDTRQMRETAAAMRPILFFAALLTWTVAGMWVIHETPNPFIDVFTFQQESAEGLLHGKNPYAMTYTNIYGQGSPVYAQEFQKDGRVTFGFPYAPLSLFMVVPGYLAGDHRYAQLFALVIAAGLIACSRPGIVANLAAILLLTSSRVFMVIELGWTEPLVILWLAATVWCACRRPKWVPYALGLLLASKQYTLFIPPLALLLVTPKFSWRGYFMLLLKACIVAAAITLPLVLWDPQAFWKSAVALQLKQPLREDALSYLLWYYWHVDKEAARAMTWLPYAGVAMMTALAIWLWPRNAGGFAGAVAVVYFTFFALNRQAFCNYYFLVIAAMCCAIAALDHDPHPQPIMSPEQPKVPELVEMALQ